MSTNSIGSAVGFKRCAVCKIDLKGRFVYIDDGIEELLGFTREELFGKTLLEFLDDRSQKLIEQLLELRNHYETFYDATSITIFNRKGESISSNVVVSLNFIAGNPANFQIIINPDLEYRIPVKTGDFRLPHRDLYEEIIKLDDATDLKQFVCLLCNFSGASCVAVYCVDGNVLELRSVSDGTDSENFSSQSVSPLTDLHRRVAAGEGDYSFTDQDAVQSAIETDGKAPDEIVRLITFKDETDYCFRIIFEHEINTDIAAEAAGRIDQALNLFKTFTGALYRGESGSVGSLNVRFTIGFLDSLHIGAAVTSAEGEITGYNPTFVRQFKIEEIDGHFSKILKLLEQSNNADLTEQVTEYFRTPLDESAPEDFEKVIVMPDSETVRMMIIKFSMDPGDSSCCLVFVPDVVGGRKEDSSTADSLPWREILKTLKESSHRIADHSDRICHEYYSQLDDSGNSELKSLYDENNRLSRMLVGLEEMIRLAEKHDRRRKTDLGLLLTNAVQKAQATYPEVSVSCKKKNLPKLEISTEIIEVVLNNLISNSLKFCGKPTLKLTVEAHRDSNGYRITIRDNGRGIPSEQLPCLFDFDLGSSCSNSTSFGIGGGLAVSKFLVNRLGGELDISSIEGKGTIVCITLPDERAGREKV